VRAGGDGYAICSSAARPRPPGWTGDARTATPAAHGKGSRKLMSSEPSCTLQPPCGRITAASGRLAAGFRPRNHLAKICRSHDQLQTATSKKNMYIYMYRLLRSIKYTRRRRQSTTKARKHCRSILIDASIHFYAASANRDAVISLSSG
jgi:hypothetical protein